MSDRPEIVSLLGVPCYARPATGADLVKLEEELQAARNDAALNPAGLEARILLGRRLAYLWRYCEAIAIYTAALEDAGACAALYRHRGHRYISVRRFGPAAADLAQANRLQPGDFDIVYHLGLARWLLGDFTGARAAYESFLPICSDDEQRVAMTYWLHLTLARLGEGAGAAELAAGIGTVQVVENIHYYDLLRLFRGDKTEDDILTMSRENSLAAGTLGFGLGCWHLAAGRRLEAMAQFEVVVAGKYWPSFGFIAAETELARLHYGTTG